MIEMICPKCNSTIVENGDFCSSCGENLKVQTVKNGKYCRSCGEAIDEGDKFCGKCGTVVGRTKSSINTSVDDMSSRKIKGSYCVSIINAIICFIIRISVQERYYMRSRVVGRTGQYVMGIVDENMKAFLTFIPVVAAVIVCLMLVSDKKVPLQEKLKALIINSIFIALSILFVWFHIPS